MSGISSPNGVRECTVCGFRQTFGQNEDVMTCPDCGSISWTKVDLSNESDRQ